MRKIAIICDIDGCIVPERGKSWDYQTLEQLIQAIKADHICFGLSSGRPAGFQECLARQMQLTDYCICENGSILMHPMKKIAVPHPDIPKEYLKERPNIREKLNQLCEKFPAVIEFGKEIMFSVNAADKSLLTEIMDAATEILDGVDVDIMNSGRSIEIIPKGITKAEGLAYWAELQGVTVDSICAIGDGDNDLSILSAAGTAAAPSNCSEGVRNVVDYVSESPMVKGILDIVNKRIKGDI